MHRKLIAAAAVAVTALAGTGAYAYAAADTAEPPQLELLQPTGDDSVGRAQLHLVDSDRADPWVPSERRELMVSMFYPSKKDTGGAAQYMTPKESELFLKQSEFDAPPDSLSKVKMYARDDAKPLRSLGKRPLVVVSPGFSKPRASLTGLAEDLASRGYIAAVVGHNYESVTQFPDGHVTECEACDQGEAEKAEKGRVKDVGFVLDQLTDHHSPWSRLIDRHRIAMVGHSLGGATGYSVLRDDKRVKAAMNIDGTIDALPTTESRKPFMLLGHLIDHDDKTWTEAWKHSAGWKRWVRMKGTEHVSFTDIGLLLDQFGMPPAQLDERRATRLTRELVSAFLDVHLRGEHRPILDSPSADNPELDFHS
ncbi:MAG TPA: hypothetical protein VE172_18845 [Stackebrandtia sp.]|uniref:alpha/beta hydrolase family protein n=1 Tax=Stackebrandtia sp. TaxID=2023065 RepID=UPI002D664F5A|nr:hypothetical protein [Stackebrandtia sp.]HZE40862.1 hypothetical protein [Stackebrandtia sp.]